MRGIAILAIMLHNYCHFIGKIVKENEYMYHEVNNDRLWCGQREPGRHSSPLGRLGEVSSSITT